MGLPAASLLVSIPSLPPSLLPSPLLHFLFFSLSLLFSVSSFSLLFLHFPFSFIPSLTPLLSIFFPFSSSYFLLFVCLFYFIIIVFPFMFSPFCFFLPFILFSLLHLHFSPSTVTSSVQPVCPLINLFLLFSFIVISFSLSKLSLIPLSSQPLLLLSLSM